MSPVRSSRDGVEEGAGSHWKTITAATCMLIAVMGCTSISTGERPGSPAPRNPKRSTKSRRGSWLTCVERRRLAGRHAPRLGQRTDLLSGRVDEAASTGSGEVVDPRSGRPARARALGQEDKRF